jgi:hypothetical protein
MPTERGYPAQRGPLVDGPLVLGVQLRAAQGYRKLAGDEPNGVEPRVGEGAARQAVVKQPLHQPVIAGVSHGPGTYLIGDILAGLDGIPVM